jgi:adenylate kinase family enzyme
VHYHRLHIIGGPGSGKSYVAAKVAATLGVEAYDLDDLFWDPGASTYGVKAGEETRNQALTAIVMRDAWVIEGVYYKWLTPSFERADLIIVLDTPVWLRDWRIVKRTVIRMFRRSPSMKKETLASLFKLLQWNHAYEKDVLAPARALIDRLGKSAVACRTLSDVFDALIEHGERSG